MKKLLIVLAILAMVSGGATAAWIFYLRPLVAGPGAEATAEPAVTPEFVTIKNFVMPVIYEDRVTYHITLSATLEVADEETAIAIKRNEARLRDVLVTELHALFARRFVQDDGLTGPLVRRRLLQMVRERFGAGAVRGLTLLELERRVPSPVS